MLRKVDLFETQVGRGPGRIFHRDGTCDERFGRPQWRRGAWNSVGKDYHCCLNRCDALLDDHPGICFHADRVGVNVFPIRSWRNTHTGNTAYNNVFLALEALAQQLRANPSLQSTLRPNLV